MYSLTHSEITQLIFESTWEDWATLEKHREHSPFAEGRMLTRFEMKVTPHNIATHIFEEVA